MKTLKYEEIYGLLDDVEFVKTLENVLFRNESKEKSRIIQ